MASVDQGRFKGTDFRQSEDPGDAGAPRPEGDEVRAFCKWRCGTLKALNSLSRTERKESLAAIVGRGRHLLSGKVRELSDKARQGDPEFQDIYALNVGRKQAAAALALAEAQVEKLRPLQERVTQLRAYSSRGYWVVRDAIFEADRARRNLRAIQGKMDGLVEDQPELHRCIRRLENIVITDCGRMGLEVDYDYILFGDR